MPILNTRPPMTRKEAREMTRKAMRLMNLAEEDGKETEKSDWFQDFFGYREIYSDEESKEWMKKPKKSITSRIIYCGKDCEAGRKATNDGHTWI